MKPCSRFWTNSFVKKGDFIFSERKTFLETFLPLATSIHQRIAGKDDGLSLVYESQLLKDDFATLLTLSRSKDLTLQRTTAGIHRDDLLLYMGSAPFKTEASQGQRKSLLFALKLAEWQVLKEKKRLHPHSLTG
eukprot:Opistho-1_new@35790